MKLREWVVPVRRILAVLLVLLLGVAIGLTARLLTAHAQQPGAQITTAPPPKPSGDCVIDMAVLVNKELMVTVSCIPRDDIRGIVSEVFAKDREDVKRKLDAVLDQSGDVTLTLTSKKRMPQ